MDFISLMLGKLENFFASKLLDDLLCLNVIIRRHLDENMVVFILVEQVVDLWIFIAIFNILSALIHLRFEIFFLLGPEDAENITETGVAEGWLEVRPGRVSEYKNIYYFEHFLIF